jgi:peroxiredoxin
VVAIVAQASAPVRRYIEETGLPFNILIDEDRSVTKAYGVWHKMGLDAWNISRPALFVVSKEGIVRTVWVAERQEEFPGSEEILNEL